jgi:hypothetical protein
MSFYVPTSAGAKWDCPNSDNTRNKCPICTVRRRCCYQKEKLQRLVGAYNNVLGGLEDRKSRAETALHVLEIDGIGADHLRKSIAEEIRSRISDIESTSYQRDSALLAQRANERAAKKGRNI